MRRVAGDNTSCSDFDLFKEEEDFVSSYGKEMWGGGFAGGGFGAGGAFGGASRRFEEQYHCYSVAYADKSHLEVRALLYVN